MAMNRRDFGKVMLGVTGGLLAGAQIAYGAEEKKEPDLSKLPTHDCAGKNACKGQGGCKCGDAVAPARTAARARAAARRPSTRRIS